ncbi:MAG: glutamate 5-kinase [Magnetovibrionaceae bacterium]
MTISALQTLSPADGLAAARRVVIKIGSALLVEGSSGRIRRPWLESLGQDIAALKAAGQDVVLVSSGAIAVGRRHLGLKPGTLKLEQNQAAAATGMVRLAHAYQEVLGLHDLTIAQILLTSDDTENRRRYLNARRTLSTLLELDAVPLINENDTVATEEIRFGDNDRLAARVAAMIDADLLVLLSDIDGLYEADPRDNPDATFLSDVRGVTPEIEAMAGAARTGGVGSGGMVTKLAAARIANDAGCAMLLCQGGRDRPLQAIREGARCTWFHATTEPKAARKSWIAGSLKPQGQVVVDAGALAALAKGKSLLAAGVVEVRGTFQKGEAVTVLGPDDREVAKGLIAYNAEDAKAVRGQRSDAIEAALGWRGPAEMIHRDDLVLL